MPDWSTLVLFFTVSLALLLTPGPAVLYIVARSIDQGRLAGIVSAVGVGLGTAVHVLAAASGLSALLVSSALAFNLVKYLGAAYLVYLGIHTLLAGSHHEPVRIAEPYALTRIFWQGVVVNLLNPKTALFFFAFLPQFVAPSRGPVALQILVLGFGFVLLGICSDSLYALLAGAVRHWLQGSIAFLRGQRYVSGGIYITLGITTALSGSKHQ